jgi:cytochrome P450
MVVDEAMRLYPPAWAFSRQALGDDTLGGFHLPSGLAGLVIPYVLHRLPQYWKDPDAFEPERFSPEQSADRPEVCLYTGSAPDRGNASAISSR